MSNVKQDYVTEGVVSIDSASDKNVKVYDDEKVGNAVNDLTEMLNSIITRVSTVEAHISTLFTYVSQQINGNVFDVYVIKCIERLTDKKGKLESTLVEKESQLKSIIDEKDELNVTLEELDNALKGNDFALQIASIINDRKNSIISRIDSLKYDNIVKEVETLKYDIDKLSQKINTLSNFTADDLTNK